MDNGSLDRALLPPDCLSRPPGAQLGGVVGRAGIEPAARPGRPVAQCNRCTPGCRPDPVVPLVPPKPQHGLLHWRLWVPTPSCHGGVMEKSHVGAMRNRQTGRRESNPPTRRIVLALCGGQLASFTPSPGPGMGKRFERPVGRLFCRLQRPGACLNLVPRGALWGCQDSNLDIHGQRPVRLLPPSPYRVCAPPSAGAGCWATPPFAAPGHPPKGAARCLQGQQQPGGTHAPQEAGGSRTFQAGRSATGEASPADDPATLRPQRNGCCCGPPEYRARQAPVLSIEWR